eukprot:CAMPEP_0183764136 /NCGR_PEP_ID=MMETSP0739-20130205/10133_1 /TAXON_ID=385413 /ORGANISM="Thalassiosira miniscula, Strain CCMP1093" /LENGTH=78 /DNA_ID=CAMNT_0026002641 /DNA_START=45 /DNA_END=283 /DNA_ORIENTATION=+
MNAKPNTTAEENNSASDPTIDSPTEELAYHDETSIDYIARPSPTAAPPALTLDLLARTAAMQRRRQVKENNALCAMCL